MKDRRTLLPGLFALLAVVNGLIVHKEHVLRTGRTVLLELAPVDPRSLMAGDYMALDYAIARNIIGNTGREGSLTVKPDCDGVARSAWVAVDGKSGAGEQLLAYKSRGGRIQVGADGFYFQEGDAHLYANAKYGELKVTPSGQSVLVGLRDAQRRPIGRQ